MREIDASLLMSCQADPFWNLALECKGRCAYCDLDGSTDYRILANFEMDHLIPKVAGGTDHRSNRVLACRRCNDDKWRYNPCEGVVPQELTQEQRRDLISKSRQYVETKRGRFYSLLHDALNQPALTDPN